MSFLPAPLEVLWEAPGLPAFDLPAELEAAYGGPLGFASPRLFVNFVESADGVVAIPSLPNSNRVIAGESASDRFVMGLLRACADAVVIGSGTMNAAPRSLWTAEQAYPDAAGAFAELRRRLGLRPELELVVLTALGTVEATHPAFAAGALVVTTDVAQHQLREQLPPSTDVESVGETLDVRATLELLRARGHDAILSEGGPHVLGSLLAARLVDELFLTVSPVLLGRTGLDARLALVEGADLLPGGPLAARLLGIRRHADHLFLRYAL
jgi:riboflavin biosynthesis pyrimidine reductase